MRSSRPASSGPSTPLPPNSSRLSPLSQLLPWVSPRPLSRSYCCLALGPLLTTQLPEDPLLPASFSRPCSLCSFLVPGQCGLLCLSSSSKPLLGNLLGLVICLLILYPSVAGQRFQDTPPPQPPPHPLVFPSFLLKSAKLQGKKLASPRSAAAEVWRFSNQTCVSSFAGTHSSCLYPPARNQGVREH